MTTKKEIEILKKKNLTITIKDEDGNEIVFAKRSALGEMIDYNKLIHLLSKR